MKATLLLCGGLGGKRSRSGPTSVYTEDISFPGAQIIKPEGEAAAMLTRSIEFGGIHTGMPSSKGGGGNKEFKISESTKEVNTELTLQHCAEENNKEWD